MSIDIEELKRHVAAEELRNKVQELRRLIRDHAMHSDMNGRIRTWTWEIDQLNAELDRLQTMPGVPSSQPLFER